jgi:porphobilinogen synthase
MIHQNPNSFANSFPNVRARRNRKSVWIRELLAQNHLKASDLIMPFFVIEGVGKREKIESLPDQYRFSIDALIEEIKRAKELGIKAVMLFPAVEQELKTLGGEESYNENNLVCRAVREIKKNVPDIGLICDVALDPYTSHGHDGILSTDGKYVLNDQTLAILCKQSLAQAKAGCDIIAPSDMMDGRVGQIRKHLDQNGFELVGIMSYAAKYASNFYGPFRNAVGSERNLVYDPFRNAVGSDKNLGKNLGKNLADQNHQAEAFSENKKANYQMDFRNSDEALREINLDVNEGADMLIIKPGLPYLDIVTKAKQICNLPIISYQVSGEYVMLKLAAQNNLLDFHSALYETLIAFKRAGASAIISYGAMEMAEVIFKN